jgi:hypothetical protein
MFLPAQQICRSKLGAKEGGPYRFNAQPGAAAALLMTLIVRHQQYQ